MKQFCISFFLFFVTQKVICQTWVALGSNEQTSSSITTTGASTFFTQVSNDGVPYISYIDDAQGVHNVGDFKVHAQRFRNGQWELAGDGISPSFPGSDDFPVALDGNVPYVAYSEAFTPVNIQNKLSVKKLNSNTNLWEVVGQLGFSDGVATGSVIAADNGKIYVAYNDGSVDGKITVKRFDNANPNAGWQTVGPTGLSNGVGFKTNLVVDNGIPYVAYRDFSDDRVYVKKFNGTAWENVGTNNPANGLTGLVNSLKFNSSHIPFIAFINVANGGEGTVRSLDATNTWVTVGTQPFSTGLDAGVSLSIFHDILFVAFGKRANNVMQVHVKSFNPANGSWPDVGTQPVTASPSFVDNIVLTNSNNNKLLLVFRNLNSGIYAKTFDATGIVPVTLTSFTVTRQNNKSLLRWITATELNNKLFEIEHSTDGLIFTKIGEALAKTPADIGHDYSFIHNSPVNGINFYRLKQVDNNDQFTYSNIISITFSQGQRSFITLLPNPVKNVIHSEFLTDARKEIIIRNAEGRTVKRVVSNTRSVDINIADLAEGTYFISLYEGTLIETRSFIK